MNAPPTGRRAAGSPPAAAAPKRPTPGATRLSPKKLLHTKWTAAVPRSKEKHFLVTKVFEPAVEGGAVEFVELEAVHTKRVQRLAWRGLADAATWLQGWK